MVAKRQEVWEQSGGEKETPRIVKKVIGVEEFIKEQLGSLSNTALVSMASKGSGGGVRIQDFDDKFDRLVRLKRMFPFRQGATLVNSYNINGKLERF